MFLIYISNMCVLYKYTIDELGTQYTLQYAIDIKIELMCILLYISIIYVLWISNNQWLAPYIIFYAWTCDVCVYVIFKWRFCQLLLLNWTKTICSSKIQSTTILEL